MSEKGQLKDQLQEKIKLQNKSNQASLRNCRFCTLGVFVLLIVLAIQVVQSNKELRKTFTWKNAQTKVPEIID